VAEDGAEELAADGSEYLLDADGVAAETEVEMEDALQHDESASGKQHDQFSIITVNDNSMEKG